MDAVSALPPSQQRDAMHAFGSFKAGVLEFLKSFMAEGGRVVTQKDVQDYFERNRREGGGGAGGDGGEEDGRRVRPRQG